MTKGVSRGRSRNRLIRKAALAVAASARASGYYAHMPTRQDTSTRASRSGANTSPTTPGEASDPASEPTSAARLRMRRVAGRRSAALVSAAVAAALFVSACGGSSGTTKASEEKPTGKPLDLTRVEKSIATSILAEKGMHATIQCPSYVEQRKGNNFTCYAVGTVGTGKHKVAFRTPFEVVQQNDKGYVYYHS